MKEFALHVKEIICPVKEKNLLPQGNKNYGK